VKLSLSGQVSGTPADHLPSIPQIVDFVTANPAAAAIIAVVALVVVVLTFLILRAAVRAAGRVVNGLYRTAASGLREWAKDRPGEDILTIVAASIATVVSALGMWRFFGDVLGFAGPFRLLLFAFIEVAVITSAVRARRNMRENFSAGIDGIAVWALTSLSAVLSAMDARSLAEAIFRLAAPLVAAWLWERGMAIERHRITGRSRINWRLTPERVMVYLGLAEASDRTAGEVDVQRRLTRVALAAQRARELRDTGASDRRVRRAMARYRSRYTNAAERIGLARNPALQEALESETAALRAADELLNVDGAATWTTPATPAPDPEFTRLADETARLNRILATKDDTRASLANLAMLAAAATGQRLSPSDRDHRDHRGDQTATTIPGPRYRTVGTPGTPWPIGHLVPFVVPVRHNPHRGGGVLPPTVPDRSRPVGRTPDQAKAIAYIRYHLKQKGVLPTKRELAGRDGYGGTWWLERLRDAKRALEAEGWTFPDDGPPVAPVAIVNGSRPASI
jgi:hypothetical protein